MAADSNEEYLLLLLSDSALPTGGFVASSGLESHLMHGHSKDLLSFIRTSLHSQARLCLSFIRRAHQAASRHSVQEICALDKEYHNMLLNHVARRASIAQGGALLMLYSKAFADKKQALAFDMNEELRKRARDETDGLWGHFPVCFAVLTASLGLSEERSCHLFLFLHARSLLSSAVRLNLLGPYAAQRVLLQDVRELVKTTLEDGKDEEPATTWPLGEILSTRHDRLHSRIFNS